MKVIFQNRAAALYKKKSQKFYLAKTVWIMRIWAYKKTREKNNVQKREKRMKNE